MIIIKGIPASPGIEIGKAFVYEDDIFSFERRTIDKSAVKDEIKRFKDAVRMTQKDLDRTEKQVLLMLGKQHARLIDTHIQILKDPLIVEEVPRRIHDDLINAEYAISEMLNMVNKSFEKINDEFFRERRHDLFDVGKRLLEHLLKKTRKTLSDVPPHSIVVAHNLYPSETLVLREIDVLGFCTDVGGKTSHTAILAQSMEIPAVVGLGDVTRQVKTGDTLVVDGDQGILVINPGPEALEKYKQDLKIANRQRRNLETVKKLPSVTRDGKAIKVMLNLDPYDTFKTLTALQPDGIGLLRTESIYMNKTVVPSVDEHYEIYKNVIKAFSKRPITIRLADIGGDKLTGLGLAQHELEANPFMGLRGVRLFLKNPELMYTQFKAILKAAGEADVKIMVPMVTTVEEVASVRAHFKQAVADYEKEEGVTAPDLQLGIMVEVPAAALTLDSLLEYSDFVSVGTNDLIQYIMAVDRGNEHVANLYDPLNPAVLRTLHYIIQTAHKKGKSVSICGEMAADPMAIKMLIGLGVDTLSVSPAMFYKIKYKVRQLHFDKCLELAQMAFALSSSAEIKEILRDNEDT